MVRLDRAQSIFLNALEIPSEGDREAYLEAECQSDQDLRREVDSLLDHAGRMGDFMGGRGGNAQPGTEPTLGHESSNAAANVRIGTQIGNYKIREQIGEGGMGTVYVAEQENPVRRKVALKIVKPGMATKDVVARFEAERQALAMMEHPSIARVFDGGTTEAGQPYFVMELVHGVPVTEYCDRHKLSNRERVTLFAGICQAVEHAHKRGIIHRDLKPSNVMVAEIDGKPVAKVIDFGVAKAVSQRLTEQTVYTQYSQMIGTPLYMSPEQAGMGVIDVDTRTDVYSLGVMLYELLTGDTPVDRKRLRQISSDEMRRVIREEEPKRPSAMISTLKAELLSTVSASRKVDAKTLSRSLSGELDWIVLKALEKDRERRYESARAFAEDLERYLSNEAVIACPPSIAYRVRKFAHRNQHALATSAGFVLLLLAGIAVTSWQAWQAAADRDRAVAAQEKAIAEAKLAQAINEFVDEDLLGLANVQKQIEAGISPDPEITLRTVLDVVTARLANRFPDRPEVEATIRYTIGEAYGSFGEVGLAKQQFDIAKRLREECLGSDAIETIEAEISSLNSKREYLGTLESIDVSRLVELVTVCEARFGETAETTLRSQLSLVNALSKLGKSQEAEPLARQALVRHEKSLGSEHKETLVCYTVLGRVLSENGSYVEAETVLAAAIEKSERTLGADHHVALDAASFLGQLLVRQKRFAEAEAIIRRTLEIKERVGGKRHAATLAETSQLAACLFRAGNHSEAERIQRELLVNLQEQMGDEHVYTLIMIEELGQNLRAQGRHAEALQEFERCLEVRKRLLGDEQPVVLRMEGLLAVTVFESRDFGHAEKLFRTLLVKLEKVSGQEDHLALSVRNFIAVSLNEQGKSGEAEDSFRELLRLQSRVYGESDAETLRVRTNLGLAIGRQNRPRDAAKVLSEVVNIGKNHRSIEDPQVSLAASQLAVANENWLANLVDEPSRDSRRSREGRNPILPARFSWFSCVQVAVAELPSLFLQLIFLGTQVQSLIASLCINFLTSMRWLSHRSLITDART